jgi:hypothetical protein
MKQTCEAMRDNLLVAELAELRGEGDSRVAEHVRTCAACRALAANILEQQGYMATSLATLRASAQPTIVPIKHKSARAVWWSVPLAAAAILTLLLVRPDSDELPNVDALTRLMFRSTPVITPSAGRQAVVLEKNEMTIVWLYQ